MVTTVFSGIARRHTTQNHIEVCFVPLIGNIVGFHTSFTIVTWPVTITTIGLEGKVALITGGTDGTGEATAQLFARHGAKVVTADLQQDLDLSVCHDLGSSATFVCFDISVEDDVRRAVDVVVREHNKLNIVFNNVGVVDKPNLSIVDNEAANFEWVLAVNLLGVFLGTKHAANRVSIVTTAITASILDGLATHGYTCSKHVVVGLMRSTTTIELGCHGIRVKCVSPALVATPLATGYGGASTGRRWRGWSARRQRSRRWCRRRRTWQRKCYAWRVKRRSF